MRPETNTPCLGIKYYLWFVHLISKHFACSNPFYFVCLLTNASPNFHISFSSAYFHNHTSQDFCPFVWLPLYYLMLGPIPFLAPTLKCISYSCWLALRVAVQHQDATGIYHQTIWRILRTQVHNATKHCLSLHGFLKPYFIINTCPLEIFLNTINFWKNKSY